MVPVKLSELGYDALSGYLLLREDTAVFRTGNPGASFVHGGNSPQERIIPVLTVTRKRSEQPGYAEYAVEVEPKSDVMGLHWLRLRVGFAKDRTTSLAFAAAKSIDLTLRALDHAGIQVVWKEIAGAGSLKGGRLQVPLGEVWTDVFFGLTGPQDDRVRIEIYHADNVERVQAATPVQWYSVSGQSGATPARSRRRVQLQRPGLSTSVMKEFARGLQVSAWRLWLRQDLHGQAGATRCPGEGVCNELCGRVRQRSALSQVR